MEVASTSFETLRFMRDVQQPSKESIRFPLDDLVAPHVDSYDEAICGAAGGILDLALQSLEAREVEDAAGNKMRFWMESVVLERPTHYGDGKPLMPRECRERGVTYKGRLRCTLQVSLNDAPPIGRELLLGHLPVMVRSRRCHLHGLSPNALVASGEDAEEAGGYFIVNGIERIIRLLIVARRNHPMGLIRSSLAKRGPQYTQYGMQMRCVRPDGTSQTIYLHYLTTGALVLRVHVRKAEYLIPLMLILRCLGPVTDKEIVEGVVHGDEGTERGAFIGGRVEGMIRDFASTSGLGTHTQCLSYLGERMATVVPGVSSMKNFERGALFLAHYVMVHLSGDREKLEMLLLMARKLYSLVAGTIIADNPDSPANQEALLPGQIVAAYLKDKADEYLSGLRAQLASDVRKGLLSDFSAPLNGVGSASKRSNEYSVDAAMARVNSDLGRKIEYFLASGNISSSTGLDLQQTSGFTVVAERLNYMRFISHFRSIHRGAFFAELKTTTVRKLAPEAWGFLCPVHTPDGAPCGLLNHLTRACRIVTNAPDQKAVESTVLPLLHTLGCVAVERHARRPSGTYPVVLDGRWVASCRADAIPQVARELRNLKALGKKAIDVSLGGCVTPSILSQDLDFNENPGVMDEQELYMLEVAAIPETEGQTGGLFPGVYLFSGPCRMMRPVLTCGFHFENAAESSDDIDKKVVVISKNPLTSNIKDDGRKIVHVGTMEQVFLEVAVNDTEIIEGHTQYVESNIANFMSVVANLTPFPDHNQSPRNMYQCQMGKQSMATPLHNYPRRTDNKLYRLLTPQAPIVRTSSYSRYRMDHYPSGTNAVVAVLSYTGYDMEDAMIINKMAHDRGFAHGTIYKTETFDVSEKDARGAGRTTFFGVKDPKRLPRTIDPDGLPSVGTFLQRDDVVYSAKDEVTGRWHIERYKGMEGGYVEEVRILGGGDGSGVPMSQFSLKLRIPRNPIVGDKFSSRHGQKGVCSRLYPTVDLPFSELGGLTPDVIINPHAFPSRMTIGMFVESMAGKAGALHGIAQDGTPFAAFGENHNAADYFGEQLRLAGYNYAGNEPMYSGVTGCEFRADIYIGLVYYQRLRHMVNDKFQVRTTGPLHALTQQPVKGRKRAGGIRFGEMERDSLLAHGVSFLLQDRLMNCSDYSQTHICRPCGSILSPISETNFSLSPGFNNVCSGVTTRCHLCGRSDAIEVIAVPFVFRYLLAELTAMNIEIRMHVK